MSKPVTANVVRKFNHKLKAASALTVPLLAFAGTMFAISGAMALDSHALPQNGVVAGGNITIGTPTVDHKMTIDQTSDRGLIKWDSFNIGTGAGVQFNNGTGITVNQVTANNADPSRILGKLGATGKVMILDKNGVFFGQGAQIDVGGIVASTGVLADETGFVNGTGKIALTGFSDKSVENNANITTSGVVGFIARDVKNTGAINASNISLAATNVQATIDFDGDGLVEFAVNEQDSATLINNTGNLTANGGRIALTAAAKDGIVNSTINMDGIAVAKSVTVEGGVITLGGQITANGGDVDVKSTAINHNTQVKVAAGAKITSVDGDITFDLNGTSGTGTINGLRPGGNLVIDSATIEAADGTVTLDAYHTTLSNYTKVVADTVELSGSGDFNQSQFGAIEANTVTGSRDGVIRLSGSQNKIGKVKDLKAGMQTADAELRITNAQDLVLEGDIASGVNGNTTLNVTGNIRDVNGGSLTTNKLNVQATGNVSLDSANNINTLGASNIGGSLALYDVDGIVIDGNVTVQNKIELTTGGTGGITLADNVVVESVTDDIHVNAGMLQGDVTLGQLAGFKAKGSANASIAITAKDLKQNARSRIDASNIVFGVRSISQNASAVIDTNFITGTASQDVNLTGEHNVIRKVGDVTTGTDAAHNGGFSMISYGTNVAGKISADGGDIAIRSKNANLNLANTGVVETTGNVALSSTGAAANISGTGRIIADALSVNASGGVSLTGDNNIATLQASSAQRDFALHDINGFTVSGDLSAQGDVTLKATNISGNVAAITVNANRSITTNGGDFTVHTGGANGANFALENRARIDTTGANGKGDVNITSRHLNLRSGSVVVADAVHLDNRLVVQQVNSRIEANSLTGTALEYVHLLGTNNEIKSLGNYDIGRDNRDTRNFRLVNARDLSIDGVVNARNGFIDINVDGKVNLTGSLTSVGGAIDVASKGFYQNSTGKITSQGGDISVNSSGGQKLELYGVIDARGANGTGDVTLSGLETDFVSGAVYADALNISGNAAKQDGSNHRIEANLLTGNLSEYARFNSVNNRIVNVGNFITGSGGWHKGGFALRNAQDVNIVGAISANANGLGNGGNGNILLNVTGNVTVAAGGSLNANGHNIDVNQSGILTAAAGSIQTKGTGTINLQQNAGGSINNAVQAIANTGTGKNTVLVGGGTYNENILIDKSNLDLVSRNGRGATTINGVANAGANETILITNGVNNVTVGGTDKGFTVVGFDNGAPGIENAAIYLGAGISDITIDGNEIVANGDLGLLSAEVPNSVTGLVINDNIFSGKTYVGNSWATGNQWSVNNVSRQLVSINPGASNVKFTNNHITGDSGVNTNVTIDANGAVISGNTFEGKTQGGYALRVRGTDTDVSGNVFNAANLGAGAGHVYAKAGTLGNPADIAGLFGANTFLGKTVWANNYTTDAIIHTAIQPVVDAAALNAIVTASGHEFNENVRLNKAITLQGTTTAGNTTTLKGSAGHGIVVSASDVSILGLNIRDYVAGIYVNNALNNLHIENVSSTNNTHGINIDGSADVTNLDVINAHFDENTIGMRVRGSVRDLLIEGGSMNNNTDSGLNVHYSSTYNPSVFDNIRIIGTEFNGNIAKGIYAEKLSNALIKDVVINGSGVKAGSSANAGLDINLKDGTFANITLDNVTISNSGTGSSGVALAIKARDGYDGKAAELSNVIVKNSNIQAAGNGTVEIGYNVKDVTLTQNVIKNGSFTGNGLSIYGGVNGVNAQQNIITGGFAVRSANSNNIVLTNNSIIGSLRNITKDGGDTIDARGNWFGSNSATAINSKMSFDVDFSSFLASGTDTSLDAGFQGDFSHLIVTSLNSSVDGKRIQGAIDLLQNGALTGGNRIVDVLGGTYNETNIAVNKSVQMRGSSGASIVNGNNTDDGLIITANDVSVSGMTLRNFDYSVLLNNADNFVLRNNDINGAKFGIFAYGTGTSAGLIENNRITNIVGGQAIHIRDNQYADILNNTITNADVGITTENFRLARADGQVTRIDGNTVDARLIGIRNNLSTGDQTGFVISNNTINAIDAGNARRWTGIDVISQNNGVATQFVNNTIDASAVNATRQTAGYEMTNMTNANRAVIDGGSISHVDAGVWVTDASQYTGAVNDVLVTNVAFDDITEAAFYVEDTLENAGSAKVTIGAGNVFGTNVAYELALAGSGAQVGFEGGVVGVNSTLVKAASLARFDGLFVRPATPVLPIHYTDSASIQTGVNATVAGGNVDVEAGTFAGNVTVDKALNITGAGSVNTIVQGNGTGSGFVLAADGINLAGLTATNFIDGLLIDSAIARLDLDDVSASGNRRHGLNVTENGRVNGLIVADSHFDNNGVATDVDTPGFGWNISKNGAIDADDVVKGVRVTNTTFDGNLRKGIYAEKLSDATFTDISANGNGLLASYIHGNAGIDINLLNGQYQNIAFNNVTIHGSGTNSVNYNGAFVPGVSLAVKARSDKNPATTLSGVDINGVNIDAAGDTGVSIGYAVDTVEINDAVIKGVAQGITVYGGVKDADINNADITVSKSSVRPEHGIGLSDATNITINGGSVTGANKGAGVSIHNSSDVNVDGVNVSGFDSGVALSGTADAVTLDNVTSSNHALAALHVAKGAAVSRLRVNGGEYSHSAFGYLDEQNGAGLPVTLVTDAAFNGVEFSNNATKGFYSETLDNSVLDSVVFANNGGHALDINLKRGNYSNLVLNDITSDGTLTVKVRNEAGNAPTTLNGLAITNAKVNADASKIGIMLGGNMSNASVTGGTVVAGKGVNAYGNATGNLLVSGVDITSTNTVDGYGVGLAGVSNARIVANTITASERAISVDAGNFVSVLDNVLTQGAGGTEQAGIVMNGVQFGDVTGNSFDGQNVAIALNGGADNQVTFNSAFNNVGTGIVATDEANLTVNNNTVTAMDDGIVIGGTSDNVVVNSNVVTGANRGFVTAGGDVGLVALQQNIFNNNTIGARFESGLIDLGVSGQENQFNGGSVGIQMQPVGLAANLQLVNDSLGFTRFTGQSDYYIRLEDGAYFVGGQPYQIDAIDVSFDGISAGLSPFGRGILTLSQLQQIEAMIWDLDDATGRGQIFAGFVPGLDQDDMFPNGLGVFGMPGAGFSVTITALPNVPGGQSLASAFNNITPFAGSDVAALAGMEPAAGGDAASLNDIVPAAGASTNCWSDFANSVGVNAVSYSVGGTMADVMNAEAGCNI